MNIFIIDLKNKRIYKIIHEERKLKLI